MNQNLFTAINPSGWYVFVVLLLSEKFFLFDFITLSHAKDYSFDDQKKEFKTYIVPCLNNR